MFAGRSYRPVAGRALLGRTEAPDRPEGGRRTRQLQGGFRIVVGELCGAAVLEYVSWPGCQARCDLVDPHGEERRLRRVSNHEAPLQPILRDARDARASSDNGEAVARG